MFRVCKQAHSGSAGPLAEPACCCQFANSAVAFAMPTSIAVAEEEAFTMPTAEEKQGMLAGGGSDDDDDE